MKYFFKEDSSAATGGASSSDTQAGAESRGRAAAKEGSKTRARKSASPDKRDTGDTAQRSRSKRQRSKSEIVHRSNTAELIGDEQEAPSKDKNQQLPKEVTIAKLGPFKMSLEVKNNERQQESRSKERRARHSRAQEDAKKGAEKHSTDKTGSENTRRKRPRSKSVHKNKEELKSSETKQPEASKKPEIDFNEIKTEAEYLKFEHQISTETKKPKKKKDKVVVSKLAKSDRPVREKSPEKAVTSGPRKVTEAAGGKFARSVSQPAAPPELELVLGREAAAGLKRNLSLIMDEKEKQPRLKRSSTARDNFDETSTQKHSRSKIVENLTESGGREDKMSLYDNFGFDSSPDLGQSAKGGGQERRQQTLLQLKDQIQSQLKLAAGAAAATGGTERALLPAEAGQESDYSEDGARETPPTQVQSLSEESSSGSTRLRRQTSDSVKFDTSDTEDSEVTILLGVIIDFRKKLSSNVASCDCSPHAWGRCYWTCPPIM